MPRGAVPAPAPSPDPVSRAGAALDILRARSIRVPDLPPDWHARVRTGAATAHPSLRIELPFPPTSGSTLASEAPAGVVIEGFHHPKVATAAWKATSLGADAFRAPVVILQADPVEFLIGCSRCADLAILAEPRCRVFLGPTATTDLRAFLHARLDTTLPKHFLRVPGLATPTDPAPETVLRAAHAAQQAEHAALTAHLSSRPRTDWSQRFDAAITGADVPLRILIPTTRYSTYVRHAAADLAAALRELGHDAMTLEEPADDARLSSIAYLRAARDFTPDLIVSINYTRAQLRGALPADIPFVCWVQDRMPHLFDRALGAACGPLDFLAGHIHPSLYLDFGYPRRRTMFRAVPASPRTFHAAHPSPAHACHVLYAGHQSEPPDALRDRLLPSFAQVPGLVDAARDIDARLRTLAETGRLTAGALDTLTRDALAARHIPLNNPRAVETFDAAFTRTLAERIHRHQTLQWAAEICDRRGWSMRLCGKGWDRHPTLGRFAAPPLDHSEDLRAAYASASASLHVSLATNAHQRIAECALAGGLMLRRGPSPDWQLIRKLAIRAALRAWGPGEPHTIGAKVGVRWVRDLLPDSGAPDWERPRAHRLCAAQGIAPPAPNPDGTCTTEIFAKSPVIERDLPPLPDIPLWTFPDYALPHADQTSFRTPEELERVLHRAVTDPAWRDESVRAHAAIAAEYWTTDRFATDLLDLLTRCLGTAATPAETAA